jgi:PAS domain-containing protein
MARPARNVAVGEVVRRAAHPPLGDWRFWVIQAMVVCLAGIHLLVDLGTSIETGALPGGIPVALLILPVGYAALRFGLAGSAATGLWATLLWLPDLLLPHDQGHVGSDVINLALVDIVAFVFGQQIEAERLSRARVEEATAERLRAEAGYRQLFETNRAPTLVLDADGAVSGANPAARALFGHGVLGAPPALPVEGQGSLEMAAGRVVTLDDGRDYRLGAAALPPGNPSAATQLVFEDVTDERIEGRRATRYAALVVAAEEEQRRRLARELHDEPVQLFLHLARRPSSGPTSR